jgi:hypothetical protein
VHTHTQINYMCILSKWFSYNCLQIYFVIFKERYGFGTLEILYIFIICFCFLNAEIQIYNYIYKWFKNYTFFPNKKC